MDLDRFPRGKAFYLDYHLFDITKLSPERYFDYGIVRKVPKFLAESVRPFYANRFRLSVSNYPFGDHSFEFLRLSQSNYSPISKATNTRMLSSQNISVTLL